MAKKKIKTKIEPKKIEETEPIDQIKGLAIILLTILLILVLFYLLTLWIKYEKQSYAPKELTTEINYSKILLGNILQENGTYYVLAINEDDSYDNLYTTYLDMMKDKYYKADLNDGFNQKFISEESNLKVTNIADLKVSQTTLFYIANNKIVEVYEGKDAILKYFGTKIS